MIENINWYKSWFNSPFYPILYQNRDSRDARILLDNLLDRIDVEPHARILDLACGRGRHSIYLNQKGYDVTGLDMSKSSIEEASESTNEKLNFLVGDMRQIPFKSHFDYVFNLFTSFGYFEDAEDNLTTLKSIHAALKPNGQLVMDFFNTPKVVEEMVEEEVLEKGGIEFHITRSTVDGKIRKQIELQHEGESFYFEERVEALDLDRFKELLGQAGFQLDQVFGNYHLEAYDPEHSERLILLAQKC